MKVGIDVVSTWARAKTLISWGIVIAAVPLFGGCASHYPKNGYWLYVQCVNCGEGRRASQLNPVT